MASSVMDALMGVNLLSEARAESLVALVVLLVLQDLLVLALGLCPLGAREASSSMAESACVIRVVTDELKKTDTVREFVYRSLLERELQDASDSLARSKKEVSEVRKRRELLLARIRDGLHGATTLAASVLYVEMVAAHGMFFPLGFLLRIPMASSLHLSPLAIALLYRCSVWTLRRIGAAAAATASATTR